jgi:hypothetical protein
MTDARGAAEAMLGLPGFRVLEVQESAAEVVIRDRDHPAAGRPSGLRRGGHGPTTADRSSSGERPVSACRRCSRGENGRISSSCRCSALPGRRSRRRCRSPACSDSCARSCMGWAGALAEPRRGGRPRTIGVRVSGGLAPDIFLIALAALNGVADRAGEAPLPLVIEAAHWLDAATFGCSCVHGTGCGDGDGADRRPLRGPGGPATHLDETGRRELLVSSRRDFYRGAGVGTRSARPPGARP